MLSWIFIFTSLFLGFCVDGSPVGRKGCGVGSGCGFLRSKLQGRTMSMAPIMFSNPGITHAQPQSRPQFAIVTKYWRRKPQPQQQQHVPQMTFVPTPQCECPSCNCDQLPIYEEFSSEQETSDEKVSHPPVIIHSPTSITQASPVIIKSPPVLINMPQSPSMPAPKIIIRHHHHPALPPAPPMPNPQPVPHSPVIIKSPPLMVNVPINLSPKIIHESQNLPPFILPMAPAPSTKPEHSETMPPAPPIVATKSQVFVVNLDNEAPAEIAPQPEGPANVYEHITSYPEISRGHAQAMAPAPPTIPKKLKVFVVEPDSGIGAETNEQAVVYDDNPIYPETSQAMAPAPPNIPKKLNVFVVEPDNEGLAGIAAETNEQGVVYDDIPTYPETSQAMAPAPPTKANKQEVFVVKLDSEAPAGIASETPDIAIPHYELNTNDQPKEPAAPQEENDVLSPFQEQGLFDLLIKEHQVGKVIHALPSKSDDHIVNHEDLPPLEEFVAAAMKEEHPEEIEHVDDGQIEFDEMTAHIESKSADKKSWEADDQSILIFPFDKGEIDLQEIKEKLSESKTAVDSSQFPGQIDFKQIQKQLSDAKIAVDPTFMSGQIDLKEIQKQFSDGKITVDPTFMANFGSIGPMNLDDLGAPKSNGAVIPYPSLDQFANVWSQFDDTFEGGENQGMAIKSMWESQIARMLEVPETDFRPVEDDTNHTQNKKIIKT